MKKNLESRIDKSIQSFNYAVQGIISSIQTEKHMKFHYLAALGVIFISLFFPITRLEFLAIFFAVTLVISFELINTAIERTVDLVSPEYHPLAKLAKDISAGAVLIVSINALVVGYLIFYDKIISLFDSTLKRLRGSNPHLTFLAVLLVMILTVGLKTFFKDKSKGTPFQGGAVSGHAALSFCLATSIGFLTMNGLVTIIALAMAALVAESRVEGKIHSVQEVILGAILGTGMAIFIFQVVG